LASTACYTIGQAAEVPAAPKAIQAIRIETAPTVDGDLGDPIWQQATIVEDLHEVSPDEFSATSEPSQFYILYDQHAIYVGGRLWESDPKNVSAQSLRQGEFSFGEDSVSIILDPHNNGRSGYIFDLTPNGIRNEALFSDVTNENWSWQGIWHGAATKDSEGWVAEFEIPFKTLSFDPANDTWGINFARWRARNGEYYGWVSHNRAINPANSGKLQGLAGLDQGVGLDVVPGIRIAERRDFATSQSTSNFEPSIDVFYKLTPALTTALTVNTDFSGTGADARQINLSRFSLFFPERRDFFLQDTDIFQFGRIGSKDIWFLSTFDEVESESGRPFFSRRVGLSESGEPIDLDVGGKLTGRIGQWEIGLLDIQQAGHSFLDSSGQLITVDSSNLFVGRAAANVFGESMLGVIITNGDPTSDRDNTLVGVDFRYLNTRLANGRTIEGALWYQQTDTDGLVGDDAAYGVSLKMPNRQGFRTGLTFKELQANFFPGLGFVNRVDVRDYTVELGYTWISQGEFIKTIYTGIDAERIDTITGDLQSQNITIRAFEAETKSSEQFRLHYILYKEQLFEPFEISEEIFIPPGLYSFDQYCVWTETGSHRSLAVTATICGGDFYDGDSTNVFAEITWRPNSHFKFSLAYDLNDIVLPQGNFITRLTQLRADIAFTSTWSWENFIQYDNVSDNLGVNSILRWLPRAGREMVFVINREFEDRNETRSFKSVSSDIAFKLSYTFRF
jgi:hypothetical protein